jgi:hypothetical protein
MLLAELFLLDCERAVKKVVLPRSIRLALLKRSQDYPDCLLLQRVQPLKRSH